MSTDLNELFMLALDFYRAPLQHQGQLEDCEPDSPAFTRMLEIVSRPDSSNDLNNVASELRKSTETLISAALFLVRQLLFAEKSSHYKVLGLQQTASQKEIKKRYRTLISLFHPDKNPEGEEWSQLYAPDLNEAYNVLKNDSRRSNYDLSLSDSRRPQHSNSQSSRRQRPSASSYAAGESAPHRARQAKTETYSTSPFEAVHRITLLQKHPHLLIWGSALLILGLIIGVKYLQFPDYELEVSADQPANTEYKQRPSTYSSKDDYNHNETSDALKFALQRTAPSTTQDRLHDSTERRVSRDVVATEDVSSVINQYMTDEGRAELSLEKDKINTDIPAQQENSYETNSHITVSSESNTPFAEVNDNPPQELRTNDIKDSSEPPALNNSSDEPAASSQNNRTTNIQATTPVTVTTEKTVGTLATPGTEADSASNPFSKEKIEFLIAQYITAYDSGNLNKMTDLFSEDVTTTGGIGKEIVRNDYYKLFRDTAERSIVINSLKSETAGENEVHIHYQAHVQVRSNPASRWKYYSGGMQLTLTSVGNKLKISALSHTIEQNK